MYTYQPDPSTADYETSRQQVELLRKMRGKLFDRIIHADLSEYERAAVDASLREIGEELKTWRS